MNDPNSRSSSPKIGEELLVAFEHGDFTLLFVIGTIWCCRRAKPIKSNAGTPVNKNHKVTKIILSGHEIVSEKIPGNAQLDIHTKSWQDIIFDNSNDCENIIVSHILHRMTMAFSK